MSIDAPGTHEVVMFRSRRTTRSTLPGVASCGGRTVRGGRLRSVTGAAAVAAAALLLVGCGADDADEVTEAAAPEDTTDDPVDQNDENQGDQDQGDQDQGDQDQSDEGQGDQDQASGGSGYVHPVATDLPLPTEHCELVVHVHGQRQNGSTLVGPIGGYYHDGTVDMDAVPYGILHYENVIAGIEALDDPELATALDLVSTFHAEVAAILATGVQGEELAVALADFHYGTDPTQAGDGATLLKDFEQAWQAWVGPQGC